MSEDFFAVMVAQAVTANQTVHPVLMPVFPIPIPDHRVRVAMPEFRAETLPAERRGQTMGASGAHPPPRSTAPSGQVTAEERSRVEPQSLTLTPMTAAPVPTIPSVPEAFPAAEIEPPAPIWTEMAAATRVELSLAEEPTPMPRESAAPVIVPVTIEPAPNPVDKTGRNEQVARVAIEPAPGPVGTTPPPHHSRAAPVVAPEPFAPLVRITPEPAVPPPEEAPAIRVSIGRIDVRVAAAPPPPPSTASRLAPQLSLEDYLRSRNGGKR